MVGSANSALPNPDTLLNHLLPDQATQFEVAKNVYISVLGATAADILSYIPEDIAIVRRQRGLPITTACFAFARIFAVIYMAMWAAMFTHPASNCHRIAVATDLLCLLSMATTSLLFLRRVQALYADSHSIYWSFTLSWIGTSAVVVMLIPGTHSEYIPGTRYCIVYKVERYVAITNFMPAVFDTLVFLAISYKVAFQSHRNLGSNESWVTRFFSSKLLPVLSKAILQGGQQYYLITFGFNVISGVFLFKPSVPPIYRTVFSVPSVALTACMACRVHRIMVEAYHGDEGGLPMFSDLRFAVTGSSVHRTVPNESTHENSSNPSRIEVGNEAIEKKLALTNE
ncbi:hypothetical protein P691DRAFT_518211 [Macrolepiota fuliginosa MF-IS2]|uniref:Uncharacterized protein n=1 Tax=Macrolepiota fuliginosa MF-IS2 TaxID=1400762 RepID=A0A9P5XHH5_9AGAR|nr:hypothetical protein P691DRAFT_518211 [Macrolepiota fuliginosa MF-IS2]